MERLRTDHEQEGARLMLAVGVLVIVLVAITDVASGSSVSLIGYLILGPLIAATRARPRDVAVLVVVALAAALPLAATNDVFFELRHFIGLGLIVIVGVISVLLAGALGDLRKTRAREAEAHERLALLDRSSRLIAAPFNVATRLEELTRLPIPDLAALCVVDLLNDDGSIGGVVVSAADPSHADALREMRARFPLDPDGPHPAAVVLRTGSAQLLPQLDDDALASFATDSEHARLITQMQYGSAVVAPLIARGRRLGVMSLIRFRSQRSFNEADFAVVTDLAARASVAVDNARLFDDLRDTEGRLDAILSVVAEAVTVQDRDGQLVYVNEAAQRLLGSGGSDDLLAQSPHAILARYEMFDEHGEPLDVERLPGRAALRGEDPQPLVIRWINRETGHERWTLVKASAVRDEDGTPMLAVNIIEDVTDERRQAQRSALLAEASGQMASAAEFEIGLARVAAMLVPRVSDACTISLVDERDELEAIAFVPYDMGVAPETAQVLATAHPVLRADGTVIVAPLLGAEGAIGILTLSLHDTLRRFGASDLVLADELGNRVGLAVEHARVHRERTHIATTLQRSLLPPRLPEIAGVSIAARFRAAGASNQVGGDFYDVFDVDGGWIVVIGDVTGKGADAAAITALARYTVRTAAHYEPGPCNILDRLNEALLREAGERRRLCTAICLRIEDNAGRHPIRVTLACAGHPPPYLLRDDEVSELSTPGPLLGAFDDASWREIRLEIGSGESLVLYTDGVTDAHGAGAERFGYERLRSVLGRVVRHGADGVAAAVDDAIAEFQEGPQRDDVALLVLSAVRGGVRDERLDSPVGDDAEDRTVRASN
ncbi:MAG TPA: SpoIIE family protein phosphatase [Solirubrobacteraceae bacterium]|nr:SpoIIE family protein phosphatase [Solirubrobacteraceae bacterium]